MSKTIQLKRRVKCRLANDLKHDLLVEKLSLELVMEVPRKEVRLSFLGHIRKKCIALQETGGRLFGHKSRFDSFFGAGDLRAAVTVHDFRDHNDPHIGAALVGAVMIEERILEQLYRRSHRVVT